METHMNPEFKYVDLTPEEYYEWSVIRDKYDTLLTAIKKLENGRYRSLAITALEESDLWLRKHLEAIKK